MKLQKGKISITVVILILLVLIPIIYFGLTYFSATSATYSISGVDLNEKILELILTPQIAAFNALTSRQVDIDLILEVEGHGFIPATVKSLKADIFLEDTYLGSLSTDEQFTIPSTGTTTATFNCLLDLSSISFDDILRVAGTVPAHNFEIKTAINGNFELVLLIIPVKIPFSATSYTLTYSDAPEVSHLAWGSTSCEVGDTVDFSVTVKNVFRGSIVTGELVVSVREDVSLGSDLNAQSYRYPISLSPGQIDTVSGSFELYSGDSTNGFFLKTYWGSDSIGEQSSSYPPRLRVIEGSLEVEEIYWTSGGNVISSCEVGDLIQAHVILGAYDARVEDEITIKIRKDIPLWSDEDFAASSYTILLEDREEDEYILAFTPDEPSGNSLRGYFVEIEGYTEYTMPNEYPPRLVVRDTSTESEGPEEPAVGTPNLGDIWWSVNDQVVSTCQKDQIVEINIEIIAEGGPISGTLSVRIRKDIPFLPDEDYVVQSFTLSLNEGQSGIATVSFTAVQQSGFTFRGYFIQVDFDSWGTSWTMTDAYPPRLQVN